MSRGLPSSDLEEKELQISLPGLPGGADRKFWTAALLGSSMLDKSSRNDALDSSSSSSASNTR